ncbi:hypothetical protein LC607_13425 [Nostoc sp. CHAB 5824]|nr:hypothetical protein [Nostoc sp. CHAB 5824]
MSAKGLLECLYYVVQQLERSPGSGKANRIQMSQAPLSLKFCPAVTLW